MNMRDTHIHTWPHMRVTEIISLDFYLSSPSTFPPTGCRWEGGKERGDGEKGGEEGRIKREKKEIEERFADFETPRIRCINIINWKPDVTQTLRFSFFPTIIFIFFC